MKKLQLKKSIVSNLSEIANMGNIKGGVDTRVCNTLWYQDSCENHCRYTDLCETEGICLITDTIK